MRKSMAVNSTPPELLKCDHCGRKIYGRSNGRIVRRILCGEAVTVIVHEACIRPWHEHPLGVGNA